MAEKLLAGIGKASFEKVALLSIKYNIEATEVENILDEYLSKHDFLYGLREKILNKKEEKNKFYAIIQVSRLEKRFRVLLSPF